MEAVTETQSMSMEPRSVSESEEETNKAETDQASGFQISGFRGKNPSC